MRQARKRGDGAKHCSRRVIQKKTCDPAESVTGSLKQKTPGYLRETDYNNNLVSSSATQAKSGDGDDDLFPNISRIPGNNDALGDECDESGEDELDESEYYDTNDNFRSTADLRNSQYYDAKEHLRLGDTALPRRTTRSGSMKLDMYRKMQKERAPTRELFRDNTLPRDADDFQNEEERSNNVRWKLVASRVDDVARFWIPTSYVVIMAIIFARRE